MPIAPWNLTPLLLVAATIIQFWAGGEFYRQAWAAAKHGTTNMNTLVVIGTSAALIGIVGLLARVGRRRSIVDTADVGRAA